MRIRDRRDLLTYRAPARYPYGGESSFGARLRFILGRFQQGQELALVGDREFFEIVGTLRTFIQVDHAVSLNGTPIGAVRDERQIFKGCLLYTSPSPRDRQK